MSAILAIWEAEIGRIEVGRQPQADILQDPIIKITRAKWIRGVTQAGEDLLCECEALSSNPSSTKK
jgi:hypothetical protein